MKAGATVIVKLLCRRLQNTPMILCSVYTGGRRFDCYDAPQDDLRCRKAFRCMI